jgi:hypothetical protein
MNGTLGCSSFRPISTVRIDANGKKTFGCTSDKPVAPAQAPTLEEK